MKKTRNLQLALLILATSSCKPNYKKIDILECSTIDEENINSDCTCSHTDHGFYSIDNIDGIDSFTESIVYFYFPIEGEKRLSFDTGFYCKEGESTLEITNIAIELIKYVFNSEKYDYIYIPRNGGGVSPYNYWIGFNNDKRESVPITLTITDKKAIDIYSSEYACFKNPKNNHLYIGPGIRFDSMPEEIKNKINQILEITDKYLEDKPARFINP